MKNKDYRPVLTWLKSLGGYDWENCESAGDLMSLGNDSVKIPNPPYLVEKDCLQGVEAYRPFDDITLFTKFADAEATPESFKAWASDYGMLTRGESLSPEGRLHVLSKNAIELGESAPYGVLKTLADGTKGRLQSSESQQFWFREHGDLSIAIMIWELVTQNDMKRLSKVVQWIIGNTGVQVNFISKTFLDKVEIERLDDFDYRMEHGIGSEILFDNKHIRPWASALLRYPDIIRPAMLYVQTVINEKLKTYPLNVVIQIDEQGKLYKTLQPTSLLSAMWYQFFLVFTGEENIRRCVICGKWENMEGHRDTWKKHALCASNERVKRFRKPDAGHQDK